MVMVPAEVHVWRSVDVFKVITSPTVPSTINEYVGPDGFQPSPEPTATPGHAIAVPAPTRLPAAANNASVCPALVLSLILRLCNTLCHKDWFFPFAAFVMVCMLFLCFYFVLPGAVVFLE